MRASTTPVERRHRLVSAADLLLEVERAVAVALLERTLHARRVRVGPRLGAAEHVVDLLGPQRLGVGVALADCVAVGAGAALHHVLHVAAAAALRERQGVTTERAVWIGQEVLGARGRAYR